MINVLLAVLSLLAPTYGPDQVPPRTPAKAPVVAQIEPEPVVVPVAAEPEPVTSWGLDWDAVAQCEASGDWSLVTTGNGYYFALQFSPATWLDFGGTQAELDAGIAPSKARLIEVAEAVLAVQGPTAWPNCH